MGPIAPVFAAIGPALAAIGPVIAEAAPVIGNIATAGLGVMSLINAFKGGNDSSNEVDKQVAKQNEYLDTLEKDREAAKAKEQRILDETKERQRNYGASLLDSDTNLQSMLNISGYTSDELNTHILGAGLKPATASGMFN